MPHETAGREDTDGLNRQRSGNLEAEPNGTMADLLTPSENTEQPAAHRQSAVSVGANLSGLHQGGHMDLTGEQILTNALKPGTITLDKAVVAFHASVEPDTDYLLEITFAPGKAPKEAKLALLLPRFFTEDGSELKPPFDTFSHSRIGAYRYFGAAREDAPLVLPFRTPGKAVRALLGLRRWHKTQKVTMVNRLRLRTQSRTGASRIREAIRQAQASGPVSATRILSTLLPVSPPRDKALYILDEFSEASWSTVFDLTPIGRADFAAQIEATDARFVLFESCWNGNSGSWQHAFTSAEFKHPNARALLYSIEKAKRRGIPIVFWNKEDPMHYERYLPIAQKCDIILTTDANRVPDYRRDAPGAKVGVLPFAASPELCNPMDRFRATPEGICFAGSYFSVAHDDRRQQMDALLPAIVELNGAIYDRHSGLYNDRYAYPEIYRPFIRPAVPFDQMMDVYKRFKLFLNVNTITDSPTMMSRRVYELLACGTPVISTPSRALEEQFPDIVQIASDAQEAVAIARRLLSDEWEWSRLSHRGYREVMLNHTYGQRSDKIMEMLGETAVREAPLVTAITPTKRPHFIDRIAQNLGRQTHQNLEAVLVTQNYSPAQVTQLREALARQAPNLKRVVIIEDNSESSLGNRLNRAVTLAKGEYVAKMDDDDLYLSNYVVDLTIPFLFDAGDIVGKRDPFVYLEGEDRTVQREDGKRHRNVDYVVGPTLFMKRSIFDVVRFPDLNRGEDTGFLSDARSKGFRIYAADPFNFIQWRSKDHRSHTWDVKSEFFLKNAREIGRGLPNIICSA